MMKNVLKLYVSGGSAKSIRAISNLERIAREYLDEAWSIEVVDISENPESAVDEKIIATPTLVLSFPPPVRKAIGDLSDTETLISWLGVKRGKKVDVSVKNTRKRE